MGLQQNGRSVSVSNHVHSSTICVVNPQCRQLHPRLVWMQTGGQAQTSVTCYDTHLQRWCSGDVGRCDAAAGGAVVLLNVLGSVSVDILGTSWDQCVSMVQYCFTSTETIRLVRTESPGRPPRLSHTRLLNSAVCTFASGTVILFKKTTTW